MLKEQMNKLIWSFLILGVVSLFSGSFYVSMWTYTGEQQALRIRQAFVRSAFRQDAKWFDSRGDPQELPTLAANALTKINDGIGRKIADTFANLLSSLVSLAVAIGLDAPLALMMLAILPVVAICIAIVSIFLRRNSGHALEQYASAGAFATEVISGIKTVASLCVERWAVDRYAGTVRKAQGYSIRSGFYTGLSSGITGFLFYATYSYSFIYGTEQVCKSVQKCALAEARSFYNFLFTLLCFGCVDRLPTPVILRTRSLIHFTACSIIVVSVERKF